VIVLITPLMMMMMIYDVDDIDACDDDGVIASIALMAHDLRRLARMIASMILHAA